MKMTVTQAAKRGMGGVKALVTEVRKLIATARSAAATTVNTLQVLTNFEIGRRIVEHEQKGEKRAEYGAELLKELSARLTEEFGKGFSVTNLKLMRQFFLDFGPRIGQQATDQFLIQQQAAARLALPRNSPQASDKSCPVPISQQPIRKSPFTLSWTHYVLLLTIKDPDERSFYEIEATNQGWSVPELKRQIPSEPVDCRPAVAEGRLVMVTPFPDTVRHITAKTATTRNRLVAEIASEVVVAHAAPGSKMEALCRDILAAGKPLYSFDHPANAELIRAGASHISAMDVATFRSVPQSGHPTNEGLPRDLRA